jgi:arylsulfatase A-like enzyme
MPLSRGRLFAGLMGIVAIALVAWIIDRQWSLSAQPQWDVLLITIDTTRADRLGCYGYAPAQTPAIDQLSRAGVRYARCYTPQPLTLPAHGSLLTSLVPLSHGIQVNGERLSGDVLTLPEILQQHGYATGAVIGAFVLDSEFGLAQGCDFYDDDLSQAQDPGRFDFAERNAELVTNAALAWWNQDHASAKFLWVHFFDPHAPYEAPGFDPTVSHLTPYDAEIAFADRQVQRLLSAVDASERETLVILTSDHGEGLGEHGEDTHGLFTYETTLHVPLIVRFPDRRLADSEIASPVSLVDVMPSILHWLGLPPADDVDGVLLPLADQPAARGSAQPRPVFFENEFVARMYGWSPLRGIIVGRWKYISAPRPELYDLSKDSREKTNLFAVGDARTEQLSAEFDAVVSGFEQRHAAAGALGELDAASLKKLESLGYVGGASEAVADAGAEPAGQAADPKDMLEVYRQIQLATLHFDHGQTAEAVKLLVPIIDGDIQQPANPRAVQLLSVLVAEEPAARPQGLPCLQRLAARTGAANDNPLVLQVVGAALIAEKRFDEAVEVFRGLCDRDPSDAAAFYQLGYVYRELGSTPQAIDAYQRAISLAEGTDAPPDWLPEARRQLAPLVQKADEKLAE